MSDFITLLESVQSLHQMDIERERSLRLAVLVAFRKEEAQLAELVQDVHLRVLAGSPGYRALLGETIQVTRSGHVTNDVDFLDCTRHPERPEAIYLLEGRITMTVKATGSWDPNRSAEKSVRVEGTHMGNTEYTDASNLFMKTAVEILDDLMDETGVDPLDGVIEGDDVVEKWRQYCDVNQARTSHQTERFVRHHALLECEVLPVLREVLHEAKAYREYAGIFGVRDQFLVRENFGGLFASPDRITMRNGVMSLSVEGGLTFQVNLRDSSFGDSPTIHARAELGGRQIVMPDDHNIHLNERVRLQHHLINLLARVAVMQKHPLMRIPQTAVPSW